MEFCDECGSMMHGDDGVWVCGSCGFEKARDAEAEAAMTTTRGQDTDSGPVDMSEVDDEKSVRRPRPAVRSAATTGPATR